MSLNYKQGDLIKLAQNGAFDVIAHGCNCFCTMESGLAPQMDKAFNCANPKIFTLEDQKYKGDIDKLGRIEYVKFQDNHGDDLFVVNAYTQYKYGKYKADGEDRPLNYQALSLCLKKINHIFKGKHIGLPKIGAERAGGDWDIIKKIIESTLVDCDVTIVIFDGNTDNNT